MIVPLTPDADMAKLERNDILILIDPHFTESAKGGSIAIRLEFDNLD